MNSTTLKQFRTAAINAIGKDNVGSIKKTRKLPLGYFKMYFAGVGENKVYQDTTGVHFVDIDENDGKTSLKDWKSYMKEMKRARNLPN